jgi:hypothetical protein
LPVLIEGSIRDDEIDVEIDVARIEQFAAGKPQIDAVVEFLVAAVRPAVIVDHPDVAFVGVLGGEKETVVVKPHRALKLAEIAGAINQAAIAVRSGCAAIRGLVN